MIEFKKYEEYVSRDSGFGLNLTPLIDMVFLLLIFFLLTSFLVRPSIMVKLPETETAEVQEEPGIHVSIGKDGTVIFKDLAVSDERFYRSLRRIYAAGRARDIVILADREVDFGRVVEVMDLSKKAGAETISFLVERKK